jgi:hypothetical protein
MTPNRELMIVEHVLGPAIEGLRLPGDELWARFGIATPPVEGPARLDQRADVLQVGLIALAMLLGRDIRLSEFPAQIPELFQQATGTNEIRVLPAFTRWLARALQLDPHPFESAHDAERALGELSIDGETYEPPVPELTAAAAVLHDLAIETGDTAPRADPRPPIIEPPAIIERPAVVERPAVDEQTSDSGRESTSLFPSERVQRTPVAVAVESPGASRTVVAALGTLALLQAGIIAYLLLRPAPASKPATVTFETTQPGTEIILNGRSIGRTPLSYQLGPDSRSIRLLTPPELVAQTPAEVAAAVERSMPPGSAPAALALRPAAVRSGGIRLVTPMEVEVVDGDRVLGSSADGPIVAAAGRREFEMVNSALGYRTKQVIDIKPGQITSVSIARPNGQLNVNAVPWADVWIDGKRIGETPLANVAIPIGEHEIVFRHPTLAEQRRTVTVRFDGPARISADLRR